MNNLVVFDEQGLMWYFFTQVLALCQSKLQHEAGNSFVYNNNGGLSFRSKEQK